MVDNSQSPQPNEIDARHGDGIAAQTRALASALRDEFETPDPETDA